MERRHIITQQEGDLMSHLIVIAFDDAGEAEKVRASLRAQQKEGLVSVEDAAIVSRDAEGKLHVKNEVSRATMVGTGIGALLGLLLGGLFFPLTGLALGALGGAGVGALTKMGVDGKFVKEVKDSLQSNTSALFIIVRSADPTAVLALLRNYTGRVLQTTLDSEAEENLRRALNDEGDAT
jgi:uncharacterized membrane protein